MPQQTVAKPKAKELRPGYFTRDELDLIPVLPVKNGKAQLDRNNPDHEPWFEDDDE